MIIVEPHYSGHHYGHVEGILNFLRKRNLEPQLATTKRTIQEGGFDALDVEQICITEDAKPYTPKLVPKMLRQQHQMFCEIRDFLLRNQSLGPAIFPTLQGCGAIPLGLSATGFPVPWVGVVMAPAPHLRKFGVFSHHSLAERLIQRLAYTRLSRQKNCLTIASFDPLFAEWMATPRIVYCPDPVGIAPWEGKVDAQLLLESVDIPIISIVGSIDTRKAIATLATAVEAIADTNPMHLVVAGKETTDVEHELQSPPFKRLADRGRVTLIRRRLTNEEVDYLFEKSAVIWSGNLRKYGSSGAIVRAGMHSKPVITMRDSMMGNWMASQDGGPCVDMTDSKAICAELVRLQANEVYRETLGSNNHQIFSQNTMDHYCETLLKQLLPRPSDDRIATVNSVTGAI